MKLTEAQIAAVEAQLQVKPVPEDDDAAKSLSEAFGEHTFYLDPAGLHVFEMARDDTFDAQALALVSIAEWVDDQRTSLSPITPAPKEIFVKL